MLILLAAAAYGQQCRIRPKVVRQGDVLRVACPPAVKELKAGDKTFPLFGGAGLLPVAVRQLPGPLKITAGAQEITVTVRDARFPTQNVNLTPSTESLEPAPGEMERARAFRGTVTPERFWAEPLTRPVPGCLTSPFGVQRYHNGKPSGNFHAGVDQRGTTGVPIRAAAAGVARVVAMWNLHGGTVGIDHGQGVTSMYLHMSEFAIQEGARVEKGAVIGYVGSTGRSNAPHLHWGLFVHGVSVNPLRWVRIPPCPTPRVRRR